MTARTRRIPVLRHHKPTGQASVRIDGRDIYLGKHGTEESRERYRRVIAEWLSGRDPAAAPQDGPGDGGPAVNEVVKAFLTRHAEAHYRRADGSPTGELANFRLSLRPLCRLYGHSPAAAFRPKALKAVRQSMVDAGLARGTINQRVGRIVHLFKWAVAEELVPPAVHHGLRAVQGLRKGRTAARETEPVRPVPDAHVDAIRPHVSRQVWAMVDLQRLSGMRPGEVCTMRTADLDTSGTVWVYTPGKHKTEHHGYERKVYLGPRAQAVLRPWLRTDLGAYLFSPREAMAEFRAEQRRRRTTPLYPSQRDRRPKDRPKRVLRDHYSGWSYNHAIRYGCRRAGIDPWHPNQLRHNAATFLRKEFGLDVARAVLGHSDADTTTIYAERDRGLAVAAMERVG
jgi:integrase